MTEALQRLVRLLDLARKEDEHLLAVRHRLLGEECRVTPERVQEILSTDLGIDRLESFGAKFGRLQDTVIDKLVPVLLAAAGEPTAAAIDNLGRMERLGLVQSVDDWLKMRRLRDRLVHEYIEQANELAAVLESACRFTDRMHTDVQAMAHYAKTHLFGA